MSGAHGWWLSRRRLLALTGSVLLAPIVEGEAAAAARAPRTRVDRHVLDPRTATERDGWRIFAPLRARRGAAVVGVSWARATPERIELRTRSRRGGPWSDWIPVGAHAHAAESGRGSRASDPVGITGAVELQFRARGASDGLIARVVRVDAAAAAARARTAIADDPERDGRLARAAANGDRRARSAQARPPILPRSAWGGDGVRPRDAPSYGAVRLGFVHHTVSANSYGPDESAALVLGIARYHRDGNGWDDIGYNFLVDRYGRIFEGRGGGVDRAVVGAQAQGFNDQSTGVAVIGTFSDVDAPGPALEAVAQVLAWKLAVHGAPALGTTVATSGGGSANRFPAGRKVTLQRISGHRDTGRTECPGGRLYAALPYVRARALNLQQTLYANVHAAAGATVEARAATRYVRAGSRVLLRGERNPRGRVDVLVERRSRGRYRHLRKGRARKKARSFRIRVRLRKPGLYRLTVIADGVRADPVFVRAKRRRRR